MVCALLERWPTLEALQKARPDTLRSFFRKHHCRKEELIESRIKAIGEAMPALKDRAVVQTKVAVVKVSVQLIQVLHEGIEGDRKSTRLNSSHQIISYAVFCLKKKKDILEESR